ncbi:MAG: bacillithiol biosynthesis BshC [Deltaproteobacteria bacterium]|nr:bacillithiol biosynthesis BshC [Deltaproteobacteria bacterium]
MRERSPLFFYSPSCDSCVENARVRLEEREDEFHFVGVSGSVSRQTIVAALEREPERFTSSALLRPILQESLFPCAAYVGGEAEVRYFAQVSALPPLFDLPELCIVPRARFILLEPRIVALLGELGLSTEQIRLPESALFEALAAQGGLSSPDALRDAFIEQVRLPFSELADKFAAADKTLRQPVEKAEAKLREQVAGLFERYRLALGRLDGVRTDRLRKVLNNLRPEGKEQERVLSLPYYLARYGPLLRTALEPNVDIPAMQQKEISL